MSFWSLSNLLSGMILGWLRPFGEGDWIRFGEHEGEVLERALWYTRLRTARQIEVIVPNGLFLRAPLEQMSTQGGLILVCPLRMGHGVPREQVERLLLEAAQQVTGLSDDPLPFVRVSGIDEGAIAYELCVHTPRPEAKERLLSDLRERIVDVFAERGLWAGGASGRRP